MSKKENYNPNSAEHNDEWHNEDGLGGWEEWEDKYREKRGIPRHRECYPSLDYDKDGARTGKYRNFNSTPDFIHELDEIPKEANVPPELLRDMFNGLVVKVNKLIDWHNSLEEFEYNKIKNKTKE